MELNTEDGGLPRGGDTSQQEEYLKGDCDKEIPLPWSSGSQKVVLGAPGPGSLQLPEGLPGLERGTPGRAIPCGHQCRAGEELAEGC